jgi:signal transduction histidine kinase
MPPWFHRQQAYAKHRAIWYGALLAVGTGAVFYFAAAKFVEGDIRESFTNHARTSQNTINARIKSYTDLLRGTASMFRTSDPVTREQFREYVQGLNVRKHFPAIETINYAEYVRHQDLPAFEQRMRTGQPAGRFGGTPFKVTPVVAEPDHSIITFIEPDVPWYGAFGFDLHANSYVRATIAASRDAATLMTSGTRIVAMSTPSQTGLGMRLPTYRPGLPIDTVQQRRDAYIGSVGIAFSVSKLIKGVLDEMPVKTVRLTLVDIGQGANVVPPRPGQPPNVLFDSLATDAQPAPPLATGGDVVTVKLPIDYNGRIWEATFSAKNNALYTGIEQHFPVLAMVAGSISAILIYALLYTLTSARINALALARDMTKELRDSQARLQQSHESLRRLAAHAENIKESERKRIAREIHDDLGQNLLALRIDADMLASRTRDRHPRLHERARATLQQIDAIIKSVRQIINDLRPNVLDLGLNAAVEWQISEFRRQTGIACELVENEHELEIDDHCATALFRILQESLSNISRHAHASRVRVSLHVDAGYISMTVCDNGVGLVRDGVGKPGSFGLVGIEERMHLLGGTFTISSNGGTGTCISVSVPISTENSSMPMRPVDRMHGYDHYLPA